MGSDDGELTDDELNDLLPDNFLEDPESTTHEPDELTRATLEALDEADAYDRFEKLWRDDRTRSTSVSWPRVPTIAPPATLDTPPVPAAPSDIRLPIGAREFFDRVSLRCTKRKAGRFAPNCFGSQFLHDPDSADCSTCKFSEACKTAIADEKPLLDAERSARKERLRLTGHDQAPGDPKEREFRRALLRSHHLARYRKALERRRRKDRAYQQDKRANPSDEALIEKERQERLSALRDAIARRGKDKFLQQLRGRELEIMTIWEAEQLAILAHGPTASAAQTAKRYDEMMGVEAFLSRHKVRTCRGHFRKLEQMTHVWKRFVKSPDDDIA